MKKQNSVYIALAIILLASLACNIGSTAPSTEVEQAPTIVSEPTSPAATTVPSQEAVANDPSAGPETIDLTNPALYIVPDAPAFKMEIPTKYTGVDTAGVAKEVSEITLAEVQTQPQITQHFLSSVEGDVGAAGSSDPGSLNVSSVETVIISDQMYIVALASVGGGTPELRCNTSLASDMQGPGMLESQPKIQEFLTGQATRVENGVEVNGYVTDKYELSSENMVGGDGLVSAFVYVARDGGFITSFEIQSRTKEKRYGFDPDQFTDITTTFNYILVEDGSLDIAVPAECNK